MSPKIQVMTSSLHNSSDDTNVFVTIVSNTSSLIPVPYFMIIGAITTKL